MKRTSYNIVAVIILALIYSCGQSNEAKTNAKALQDSVKIAVQKQAIADSIRNSITKQANQKFATKEDSIRNNITKQVSQKFAAKGDSIRNAITKQVNQKFATKEDSIRNVITKQVNQKFTTKEEIQDSIKMLNTQLGNAQASLTNANANLEVDRDEMNNIKQFHYGRTTDEREEQIKNQSFIIQRDEKNALSLITKISSTQMYISILKDKLQKLK